MISKHDKILFFLGLFILYFSTSFDKISFGDPILYVNTIEDGNFILKAKSVDHFLYTNSLILFHKIVSLETIFSIKLFNSLFATLTLYLIYSIVKLMFQSAKLAMLGALIFALSFTFWRMSSTIEVCSFNGLFLALFLYFSLKYLKTMNNKYLSFASAILGISFWVHVQNIMLIPALIYMMYIAYNKHHKSQYINSLLFLFPALLLFVPSILLGYNINEVYGSSNSSWIMGTFTKSISQYLKDILVALSYLFYNFWFFIIPGVYSIYCRYNNLSNTKIFLAIAFIIPFAFGTFYNVSDSYVYFVGPYQIFILFIIDGIYKLSQKFKISWTWSFSLALILPLMYVASYHLALKTEQGNNFHNKKLYKGGLNYYLFPWLNNNVGVLEFTIEKRDNPENIFWTIDAAKEFINKRKTTHSIEEIKEM